MDEKLRRKIRDEEIRRKLAGAKGGRSHRHNRESIRVLRAMLKDPSVSRQERQRILRKIHQLELAGHTRMQASKAPLKGSLKLANRVRTPRLVPSPYSTKRIKGTPRKDHIYRVALNRSYGAPSATRLDQVSFYLSDYSDETLERAQRGLLKLAEFVGTTELHLVDERRASIWRLFKGAASTALDSKEVQKRLAEVDAAVSLALVGKAQAEVDAENARSMRDVIDGLKDADSGCNHVGQNLVVKFRAPNGETVILSRRLSLVELKALEQNPGITADPSATFTLLAVAVQAMVESIAPPPALSSGSPD